MSEGDAVFVDVRIPLVKREWPSGAGWVDLPRKLVERIEPEGFVIRHGGRELESYGIRSGDFLMCSVTRTPRPGDLVAIVGQVGDGMCVRVYPAEGKLLLLPEGTTDPVALAVPPRPVGDVRGVVELVYRPAEWFPVRADGCGWGPATAGGGRSRGRVVGGGGPGR